jgi:hypothetical protein
VRTPFEVPYAALNLSIVVRKILKWRNSNPAVFDLGSLKLDAERVWNIKEN